MEMAASEMNEAVAKKLGWLQRSDGWELPPMRGLFPLKDYCHSIEAAWEIVDYLKANKISFDLNMSMFETDDIWEARMRGPIIWAMAQTAPMAICQAFLKLP